MFGFRRRPPDEVDPQLDLLPPQRDGFRPASSRRRPEDGVVYVVQLGETLEDLAQRFYDRPDASELIAETNPDAVDEEGFLRPGAELLLLPDPSTGRLLRPDRPRRRKIPDEKNSVRRRHH